MRKFDARPAALPLSWWRSAALRRSGLRRAAPPSRPPKLDYTMTTLPNGLKVVFLEDHSTPIVHAELWYHVGSKNEQTGRTGFAHLFEHMMFKGSKNVEPEGHPSWISSVGGQSNAYTERGRDGVLADGAGAVPAARAVARGRSHGVAAHRRGRCSRPSARSSRKSAGCASRTSRTAGCNEIIYDQAFTVHPYKHPTIGSMKDLEAASIDDVREFFRTYYVPNNATLVLVGDFDTEGGAGAGDAVPRARARSRDKPVPRDIPKEPPQTKERRVTLERELAAAGGRRRAPHHVRRPSRTRIRCTSRRRCCPTARARASTASSSTRSSWRWPRSAAATSSRIPNLFFAVAIVQPGKTPEEATDALIAELDRLRNEPITAAELQQAKNQFARDYILGRESNKEKAMTPRARRRHPQRHQDRRRRVRHLHEHDGRRRPARRADLLHAGEPPRAHDHAQGRRGRGRRSERARCARAARRRRRWRSRSLPSPAQVPRLAVRAAAAAARRRATSSSRRTQVQDAAERPAGDRGLAPRAAGGQPAADRPRRRRAGSGRQAGRRRRWPRRCSIRGRRRRPPSRSPTRSTRSAARIGTGAGTDLTFISAVVMKDSLGLRARPGRRTSRAIPAFAPEEIERQRQQMLSALKVSYDDPDYLAGVVFDRLVYGFHPYGRPDSGTPEIARGDHARRPARVPQALVRRRTTRSSRSSAT